MMNPYQRRTAKRRVAVAVAAGVGLATLVLGPQVAGAAPARAGRADAAKAAPADVVALRCTVIANNVNYRSGPGTNYPSLGQLNKGAKINSSGMVLNAQGQPWEIVIRSGLPDAYILQAYITCVFA
jgi:uncharacterized protein YgiM (DUF1202 family)